MKPRTLMIAAMLVVMAGCTGDVGPTGPQGATGTAGVAGPAGPVGPQGAGASVFYWQDFADATGIVTVRFVGMSARGTLVQCWTREAASNPWLAVATTSDLDAPDGVITCRTQEDGPDLLADIFTIPFWEVLIVAITSN